MKDQTTITRWYENWNELPESIIGDIVLYDYLRNLGKLITPDDVKRTYRFVTLIKEDGTEVNGLSIIGEIQDDKFYIVKDENDEIIESSIVGVVAYDSFGQFV